MFDKNEMLRDGVSHLLHDETGAYVAVGPMTVARTLRIVIPLAVAGTAVPTLNLSAAGSSPDVSITLPTLSAVGEYYPISIQSKYTYASLDWAVSEGGTEDFGHVLAGFVPAGENDQY